MNVFVLKHKIVVQGEYQAIERKKKVECKMIRQCTTQILLRDDQITQKLWNIT
jgi:transcriptional antiterminator Rof (Rho-off)